MDDTNKNKDKPFWETTPLEKMSQSQWESLCDGCGKCCLEKFERANGSIAYTNVACRLLNIEKSCCSNYARRQTLMPDCIRLTPEKVKTLPWLPSTCAYKRVAQQQPLPHWHHLVCGDKEAVHKAGESVRNRAVASVLAHEDREQHVVDWAK